MSRITAGYEAGFYFVREHEDTPLERLATVFFMGYQSDFNNGLLLLKKR